MKDSSDYTGLEYDISTQLGEEKVEWFPDNGPKEESGEIEELMVSLKDKMGKMNEEVIKMLEKNTEEIKTSAGAVKKAIDSKVPVEAG